ncbi:MAG TPA: acyl-CoA dehydrogenase family protein [Solirubrobacteraceae bacterium]
MSSTPIAPPEPALTPDDLADRARALRPWLIEEQAATEERRFHSEELHEEFRRAGIYRLYVPWRYGGYGFDVTTHVRVAIELARGCPSTSWCVMLASNHALQIGSWFGERAQEEIFGDGEFRCASVAAPLSAPATRDGDEWVINGKVSYCSGIPYSTHYMGQALTPPPADGGPPGSMVLFVAPHGTWTRLDDWGDLLGLKGSGSHSITFADARIPAHWGLANTAMVDVDVSQGTPGYALHGDPLYHGRALTPFTLSLAAVLVGALYNALDDYERLLHERRIPVPPFALRRDDPDYQRHFGRALTRIATAEAALLGAADRHMELCRAAAEDGAPYTHGDDWGVAAIAREVMIQAWEIMQSDVYRTAGSSASRRGERIERIFRDMSMADGHFNVVLRDPMFREIGRHRLGLPKTLGNPNARPVTEASE